MPSPPVSARRQLAAVLTLTSFAAYLQTVPGIIAPFVAREFGLSDAGIASLMGFVALGALGAFGLTRLADRIGRRRVLLACLTLLPALGLASALAPGLRLYVALQVLIAALYVTVLATTMVVITEELPDETRARGQAYYGLLFSLGGAPVLLLAPLLAGPVNGWRLLWALPTLALLTLPWVRRSLPETRRFERAVEDGSAAATRARDLFHGPYRRRAIGLLAAWTLRPIGVTAVLTYLFYHGISNIALSPSAVTGVFIAGGGVGLLGIPLGARLSNRWGRRPTLATFSLLSVTGGVAYYWVPADFPGTPAIALAACFAVNQISFNAYNVAERCLDTELFPTALRATYAGSTRLGQAVATIVANFAVSGLASPLGGIVPAITLVSVATALPAVAIFLAVAPETAGQGLDESSLEQELAPTRNRYS
jgi:predicted MFS family arabinose efflux permease